MAGPVLVANRGEIAVRIVRACRELGLRSIVGYSDADAGSMAVRLADDAVRLGPAVPAASYLDVARVVAAAVEVGAWAVHPGYGMLSENADLAAAVSAAGLRFVGPPAAVVAAMGDKVRARALAREAGIPVLAGSDGPVGADDAPAAAARIGYPLLVKAAHGGGGRGMRVVSGPDELAGALAAATREATAAFGRGEVFLERHVPRPRHVEVQVLADSGGAVAVLGDRDCTVQRRHQKLLEEAPAVDLPDVVRTQLHDAARRLALAVGYRGAGTVEFLLDRDTGRPAFLEMNTRLQVEHGVTELVTEVDLVVAQLRLADGEPLTAVLGSTVLGSDALDVPVHGHAIQARVAAEDPWEGFLPTPGAVRALSLPSGPWVRCDVGVESGDRVPGEYDSLLGKVHAWAPDRATARSRLAAALDDLVVTGVATTASYLRTVLDRPDYAAMAHDTGSVERDWPPDPAARPAPGQSDPQRPSEPSGPEGPSGPQGPSGRTVTLGTDRGHLVLHVPHHGPPVTGTVSRAEPTDGGPSRPGAGPPAAAPSGDPVAPMDATVVEVAVVPGQDVDAGAVLVVLEAMKMELPVRAPHALRVDAVHVAAGDRVTTGGVLVATAPGSAS